MPKGGSEKPNLQIIILEPPGTSYPLLLLSVLSLFVSYYLMSLTLAMGVILAQDWKEQDLLHYSSLEGKRGPCFLNEEGSWYPTSPFSVHVYQESWSKPLSDWTEERSNELKDKPTDSIHTETQGGKKIGAGGGGDENQNQASKSCRITSNSLTYVSLESQKEKGMKEIFEETVSIEFPKLAR